MNATMTRPAPVKPSAAATAASNPAVLALIARQKLPTSAEVASRYRIIAGPYRPGEERMLNNCLDSLTGCRVVVARGELGLEVWRLKSECAEVRESPEDETED